MTQEVRFAMDAFAVEPTRSHDTDAGTDLHAPSDIDLPAHGSVVVHTGVHVELPPGTKGEILSKSGLNIKHQIVSTGLIDETYNGEIVVRLYNLGDEDYHFQAGDKITQLVISPVIYPKFVQVAPIILSTAPRRDGRGDQGFGSTGR